MATTPEPGARGPAGSRAWRAACPNCGAPVDFASAASASAVCSFCRSTLLRDGESLRRIGQSAELFDDHSPLQLGAGGTLQGLAFTLVGRLQYGYRTGPLAPAMPSSSPEGAGATGKARPPLDGTWNEWHALFANGRSAWLSEDNGAYVVAFDAPLPADAPRDPEALAVLRAGQRLTIDGRAWDVASVTTAQLIAAQGELPSVPRLQGEFGVVDLRNPAGEVATLDALNPQTPGWSVGRSVALSQLAMSGLRDGVAEKTLASRGLACPNCGAALDIKLDSTQSISCSQCNAVVDISQGVGAELAHFTQANAGASGRGPQIPLGTVASDGLLAVAGGAAVAWQVVGYQERCDVPADSDDDTSFWREYLLYQRTEGFAFLVDSDEGWSLVRPITGAPALAGQRAVWQGTTYTQQFSYPAKVTWVQGEFYWRVQRDETAQVTDYAGQGGDNGKLLSREQVGNEVTWSAGDKLPASVVADAFRIAAGERAALQRDDAAPAARSSGLSTFKIVVIVVVVLLLLMLFARCGNDDCDGLRKTFGAASGEYQRCRANLASGGGSARTGGGSFGGWSSGGGGHK